MAEFLNRKAKFDYFIDREIEAGVVLIGPEIKSIRQGKANLSGSYVRIIGGEPYWVGGSISVVDGDQTRSRKLLLKKSEISRLIQQIEQKNYTVVPLRAYFRKGKFKIMIGVGKGKKKFDKREAIKSRDISRELDRRAKS